jgi:hypothetical protein
MSEIPEVKNDHDSGHEEEKLEEIKDEILIERRKLSKQSIRFNMPIEK